MCVGWLPDPTPSRRELSVITFSPPSAVGAFVRPVKHSCAPPSGHTNKRHVLVLSRTTRDYQTITLQSKIAIISDSPIKCNSLCVPHKRLRRCALMLNSRVNLCTITPVAKPSYWSLSAASSDQLHHDQLNCHPSVSRLPAYRKTRTICYGGVFSVLGSSGQC